MTKSEHIKYWIDSAEHDLDTAESLFESGKYDWCLFLGHLVLEKALKAVYVDANDNKNPPRLHNLVRLAETSKLELSKEQIAFLDEVNDFNLESRYPDYKFEFYKSCTEEYSENYFNLIKEFYQWIKSLLK